MAIIKCSECGKEVSDKSHVCIHCGNPISEERINIVSNSNNSPIEEKSKNVNIKKKSSKTTKFLILAISILIIVVAIIYYTDNQTKLKKEQAIFLYEIFNDMEKAKDHIDEGHTYYLLELVKEKKWDTDLEGAFYSMYSKNPVVNDDFVQARYLLEDVDKSLTYNSEKAKLLLPNLYNDLLVLRVYIDDFFEYSALKNPETGELFKTGPEWWNNCNNFCPSLIGYDELVNDFLVEVNKYK